MAYPAIGTIKQTLKDIISELDDIGVFKTISVWNDQVNRLATGKGYSFASPACFIEVEGIREERESFGVTNQDINLIFHIVHYQLDAGNNELDMNLDVFDIRTSVRSAMTNLNPSNCSSLMFQKEKQDSKHNNIYHFLVTFKCKYRDFSAYPFTNGVYTKIPAGTWGWSSTKTIVPDILTHGVGIDIVGKTLVIG